MRSLLPCLACIASLAGTMATAAPLQFEVLGAWDGWSRPGRVTEASLRLQSQNPVSAVVTITSGGQVIHSTVQLAPGQQTRLSIPVQANERIAIAVDSASTQSLRHDLRLSLAETPVLAWLTAAAAAQPAAGFHVLTFDPADLPENAAAYSSIDALVIDRALLGSVNESQLAALLAYVASCGRTVMIGEAPAPGGLWRSAVGCGGRHFAEVPSADAAIASLERLLASNEAELPHASSFAALGGPDLEAWYLAVSVLAVCMAGAALAGIFTASLSAAVLVPVLAAAAALGFVHYRPVDASLLVWAEARSGDRLARYGGLQRAASPRRGGIDVPVLTVLANPQACHAGTDATWSWDARQHRFTMTRFAGRLFSTASLCYSGSFPVNRDAAARTNASGAVELQNAGPATWPAGTLYRNGSVQPLPLLVPGAAVTLVADPGRQATTAIDRQAAARSALDSLAILWPLDLQGVAQAPAGGRAWLLLQVTELRTAVAP